MWSVEKTSHLPEVYVNLYYLVFIVNNKMGFLILNAVKIIIYYRPDVKLKIMYWVF